MTQRPAAAGVRLSPERAPRRSQVRIVEPVRRPHRSRLLRLRVRPTGPHSDNSRLRYFGAGAGRSLVVVHTVRTQLDYFQRVIPLLWDSFTVYAVDLPGMGWSDIAPHARYEEPDLRDAVVEFVTGLDLHDVTLVDESLGGASRCPRRSVGRVVSRVVAVNSYGYPGGLERATGSPA